MSLALTHLTTSDLHFNRWLSGAQFSEVLSCKPHSRDFRGSRAEYIYWRVRVLSLMFAVLSLSWLPIDYISLDGREFSLIVALRAGFAAFFAILAMWVEHRNSLPHMHLRLAVFVLVPSLFYAGSHYIFGQRLDHAGILIGYSFLPTLMLVLLAIFPLTVYESLASIAVIVLSVVLCEFFAETLFLMETLGRLWLFGLIAVVVIWIQITQLSMLLRLYREATLDPLTGLVNRRVLSKWLDVEIANVAIKERRALSVMLFDLDRFKRVNDNYGHLTGDEVLREFARLLADKLSGAHLIGRYGGEEFLAILPDVDINGARKLAEEIRKGCHKLRVPTPDGEPITFTTSVGVAQLQAAESAHLLLKRVDDSLYQAKESGRDLVAIAR